MKRLLILVVLLSYFLAPLALAQPRVEFLPQDQEFSVLIGDTIEFSCRIFDDPERYSIFWTKDDTLVGQGSNASIVFPEEQNSTIVCTMVDRDDRWRLTWHVDVKDFYISAWEPDSLDFSVYRERSILFSLSARSTDFEPIEYAWIQNGEIVGENDSLFLQFEHPGDYTIEGIAYFDDDHNDQVTWSVRVMPPIIAFYPWELRLTVPQDTVVSFNFSPYYPESDSLSFLWTLEGDTVGLDTMVSIQFSQLGQFRLYGGIADGWLTDSVRWDISVVERESVFDEPDVPVVLTLLSAYPNPFNSTTTISFTLPRAGQVSLTVYDVMGRRIRDLTPAGWFEAGEQRVMLDGRGLASGRYYFQIADRDIVQTQPIILLR